MPACPRCGFELEKSLLKLRQCRRCGWEEKTGSVASELASQSTVNAEDFLADADSSDELNRKTGEVAPPASQATFEIQSSREAAPSEGATVPEISGLGGKRGAESPGTGELNDDSQIPGFNNQTVQVTGDSLVDLTADGAGSESQVLSIDSVLKSGEGGLGLRLSGTQGSGDFLMKSEELPSASGSARENATFVSENLTPGEAQALQTMWGGAAGGEGVRENMTIRGSADEVDETRLTFSSLVISPRKLVESKPAASQPVAVRSDYDLVKVLGEGGMGVVYDAVQRSVDREVALKMMKGAAARDTKQQHKFLSEAVVTGELDHPNIVPIYDVGSSEKGLLFYAMKKVQGTPWNKVLTEKPQVGNIEILMKVADAIAFAHSRGVVHRDLKPENVMLGDYGEVLVMDWGLALPVSTFRRYSSVGHNHSMGGTPAYMAPEMATGPIEKISFYSDVYLLGAMLYEILTKKAPHTGKNVQACLIAAAKNDIRKSEVAGELMDIAMKAMSTNPVDRHASVADFQTAIREYLSHSESILLANNAEEDLVKAETTKDYRDYSRAMFGFEEALDLWQGNNRARRGLVESKLKYAGCAQDKKDFKLGLSLLDPVEETHKPLIQKLNAAYEQNESQARQAEASKRLAGRLKNVAIGLTTLMALGSAGGLALLNNKNAVLQKTTDDLRSQTEEATKQRINAVSESQRAEKNARKAEKNADEANKNALAASANEKKAKDSAEVALMEKGRAEENERKANKATVAAKEAAESAENERQKAVASEVKAIAARRQQEFEAYVSQISLIDSKVADNDWDSVSDGLENKSPPERRHWEWQRLRYLSDRSTEVRFDSRLNAIAVNPRSPASDPSQAELAVAGSDGTAWIVRGIAERRAGTARDLSVKPQLTPLLHTGKRVSNAVLSDVAWSPDGKTVATVLAKPEGDQPTVCLWDPQAGAQVKRQISVGETLSKSPVTAIAFTADSKQFVTGSLDGTVTLWSLEAGEPRRLGKLVGKVEVVAASSDANRPLVAAAGRDRTVQIWDLPRGSDRPGAPRLFLGHRRPIQSLAFAPGSNLLASGGEDHSIFVFDAASNDLPANWGEKNPFTKYQELERHSDTIRGLSFGSAGQLLSAGQDNLLVLWERRNEAWVPSQTFRGHGQPVQGCAFASGGSAEGASRFFSAGFDQTVRLWDPSTYAADYEESPQAPLDGHDSAVLGIAFSKDGRRLVTASSDHSARTWDTCSGRRLVELKEGHDFLATAAVFSPDGSLMVSGAFDTTTRLWDVRSGVQKCQLSNTGRNPTLAISPDGKFLVTGSGHEQVSGEQQRKSFGAKVWDLRLLPSDPTRGASPIRFLPGHDGEVSAVAFSPSGKLMAVCDVRGIVNGWNVADWSAVDLGANGHTRRVNSAVFLTDRLLATASEDKRVILWDLTTGRPLADQRFEHPAPVIDVMSVADGAKLLTVCRDGRLRAFDMKSSEPPKVLFESQPVGARSPEIRCAFDRSNGRMLIAELLSRIVPTESDRLHVLRLDEEQPGFEAAPRFNRRVNSLVLTPAGDSFLALEGRQVTMLSLEEGVAPRRFGRSGLVNSAEFSPDNQWIVTATTDGTLRVWDAATGQNRRVLRGVSRKDSTTLSDEEKGKLGHTDSVNSANFIDDRQLLTAGSDGQILLWNVETGEIVRRFAPLKNADGTAVSILRATLAPGNSGLIAGCGADAKAYLWGPDGQLVSQSDPHPSPLTALDFSEDGSLLALGTQQGRIYLMTVDKAGKMTPAVLSSSQTAEVAGDNTDARLAGTNYLTAHPGSINDLEFLPQHWGETEFPKTAGLRLASGSSDSTVKLWSIIDESVFQDPPSDGEQPQVEASGLLAREVLTLRDLARPVTSLAVSLDGKSLAAGANDGSVVIWRSDTTDCQKTEGRAAPAASRAPVRKIKAS
jgi:WD40 repeat protein/serine/threonine protein kinase